MTYKQTALKALRELLVTAESKEALSEKKLDKTHHIMDRTHYYSDTGITNGILMAIEAIELIKEEE